MLFRSYAESVLANYTDESGSVDIEAAVEDGVMEHVVTTDNGVNIYGSTNGEGWQVVTEEEKNSDDWNF